MTTDAGGHPSPLPHAGDPGLPGRDREPVERAQLVVHARPWALLDPLVCHAVLKLRCDVFVVEQQCPYPEIDGRDVDAATEHRWLAPAGSPEDVLSYLRVLVEPEAPDETPTRRIGRVVTRADARGRGLAGRLIAGVVADNDRSALVLAAQVRATGVYERAGFRVSGEAFTEDGIPHVPMRRDPGGR